MKIDTSGIVVAILLAGWINGCTRTTEQPMRLTDTTYIVRSPKASNLVLYCDTKGNPMCVPRKETP